jgi:nicotinamide mononucleotide transporter
VTLEILATAATVVFVVLAVKRKMWQFPVGLLGTALFFFVFLDARLYASTALQVVFASVQVYGWWYWLRGDEGSRPRITTMAPFAVTALCGCAVFLAFVGSTLLGRYTDAQMAFADSTIFALSTVAQLMLGRKIIEHWLIWMAVNVLSVWTYAGQGLWIAAALYAGLLGTATWGFWEWRRALGQDRGEAPQLGRPSP